MRMFMRGGLGLALLAAGYLLGASGVLESQRVQAQVQVTEDGLDKDTQDKIDEAYKALEAAKDALVNADRYKPATDPGVLNVYGILTGGVDAVADLESGRGVDPETFAALYADLAATDIREDLARDAEGRMTYQGKVVRMYPINRLKQDFTKRHQLAGIEEQ